MNSSVLDLNLQKYSDVIVNFKRGNYLDVIAQAALVKPSFLVFYYVSQSCKKVNAPLELIEYINHFLSLPPAYPSKRKIAHFDFSATNIPTVDQLLTAKSSFEDSPKVKRIAEDFLFDNALLFIHHEKLSADQVRLLSNLINILGDTYRLQGQLRAAFESLKLANKLFADSFHSRVNYADLAYNLNNTYLCLENLKHANHLLYHSGVSEQNHVYNAYSNLIQPANELVVKNFFCLSWRLGFKPG